MRTRSRTECCEVVIISSSGNGICKYQLQIHFSICYWLEGKLYWMASKGYMRQEQNSTMTLKAQPPTFYIDTGQGCSDLMSMTLGNFCTKRIYWSGVRGSGTTQGLCIQGREDSLQTWLRKITVYRVFNSARQYCRSNDGHAGYRGRCLYLPWLVRVREGSIGTTVSAALGTIPGLDTASTYIWTATALSVYKIESVVHTFYNSP